MKKIEIQAKNLCFSYYKKPLCLKDFSIEIEAGERVLILGLEGEGKTTLLKILSGFETGYFGSVLIYGSESKTMPESNRNVSLLFDEPVLIKSTIQKNLEFLCKNNNLEFLNKDEIEKIKVKFKIEDLDAKIKKLSLFEKRKIALIRSYIKKSDSIFLDGQFGGLEKGQANELLKVINECFDKKTLILSADAETFVNNKDLFEELKFDKVIYLSLLNSYQYNSISDFLEEKVNLDTLKFNNKVRVFEGFVIKQQGQYYYSNDSGLVLKFDKKYYQSLNNLKIDELENENVCLCTEQEVDLEKLSSEKFNQMIAGKQICIYSAVDGSKVV